MTSSWDLIPFGTFTGEYNMGLDRDLLRQFQTGERTVPVVRFYCWDRPTVSLGTNQLAADVVNIEVVESLGYGLVHRPTGGRALLHKGDLCYAVIASRQSHPAFRTLTTTYRAIGQVISATLKSLGVNLTELPAEASGAHGKANPCFAMLNPFEVTVRGRKICGNAQFRSGDFFLQHGSLRIEDNWTDTDLVDLWPEGYCLDGASITAIEREIALQVPAVQVARLFGQAFERQLGLKFGLLESQRPC
jgi:lipoate-protein ligase A